MANSTELMRVDLRRAGQVAALLALAFQDDPMLRYAIPNPTQRARQLPWLIGANVRYGCLYGEVYATRELTGAAIWLPPGRTSITLVRALRAGMFATPLNVGWAAVRRLVAMERYTTRLHKRFAPTKHWYLSQIGVEPAHQGRGIGGALLQPMLARLDTAGIAGYLETSDEANVPFYRKRGFRIVAEGVVCASGPRVWAMRREPHATSNI